MIRPARSAGSIHTASNGGRQKAMDCEADDVGACRGEFRVYRPRAGAPSLSSRRSWQDIASGQCVEGALRVRQRWLATPFQRFGRRSQVRVRAFHLCLLLTTQCVLRRARCWGRLCCSGQRSSLFFAVGVEVNRCSVDSLCPYQIYDTENGEPLREQSRRLAEVLQTASICQGRNG